MNECNTISVAFPFQSLYVFERSMKTLHSLQSGESECLLIWLITRWDFRTVSYSQRKPKKRATVRESNPESPRLKHLTYHQAARDHLYLSWCYLLIDRHDGPGAEALVPVPVGVGSNPSEDTTDRCLKYRSVVVEIVCHSAEITFASFWSSSEPPPLVRQRPLSFWSYREPPWSYRAPNISLQQNNAFPKSVSSDGRPPVDIDEGWFCARIFWCWCWCVVVRKVPCRSARILKILAKKVAGYKMILERTVRRSKTVLYLWPFCVSVSKCSEWLGCVFE